MSTLGFMSFHGGISESVDGFTMSKNRLDLCNSYFCHTDLQTEDVKHI
jgi:hypothetical protein